MTINLNKYKQFFTPKKYSQLLIENTNFINPNKIIDLTMGEGSLLIEASKKWNNIQIYGNDIDGKCYKSTNDLNFINFYNKDIFLNKSIRFLITKVGLVDICLANPPFHLIKQSSDSKKTLNKFLLNQYSYSKYIPAEMLFILQAIQILKKEGVLSIILPDGFFVNNTLKSFRSFLLQNYSIIKIIELPIEIFEHTKAKTHIMILKNALPLTQSIKLSNALNSNYILISTEQAIQRMDYSFYKNNNLTTLNNLKKISDYNVEIIRGIPKYKLKKIESTWVLHTTNFKKGNFFISPLKTKNYIKNYFPRIAQKDDIIIPRVGSNILGRVGVVEDGYFIATDCIFIIRVKNKIARENIKYTLESEFGKEWINSISKGVGARHITLQDIVNLPILERVKNNDN